MSVKTKDIKQTARKFALQNAVSFDGTAQLKAVMGKVIATLQKKGVHPKEIIPIVKDVVVDVNKLSEEAQFEELEKIAPELLIKKKQKRDYSLPDLPHAEQGKVVTRFPPEPNGYLHIGHAKAAIVDYEYSKKYDGTFILRFDDTNPVKDNIEFYEAQKKDLQWLDISWNHVYHTSDNLSKHYKLAAQLIAQKDAYVCTCSADRIKEGRKKKVACSCRNRPVEQQKELWEQMHEKSVAAVLRLNADMTSDNSAMRDPTLFRIIDGLHPLQEDKFHVWPTYDFAGAVEDSLSGVTHPFRTKEYELRDEVYFYLLDKLGLRKPYLMEFARLSIEGMPVSKRLISPLVHEGKVSGFDDIRLPTLRGLRRRGIVPKALKQFVFQQGISKVESTVPFSLVESENRKVIDPVAKRLFFIPNPVELVVDDAVSNTVSVPFHPRNEELGSRRIEINNVFYIPQSDVNKLKEFDVFRLKDLFNVSIKSINEGKVVGLYAGKDLIENSMKIQWVPDNYVKMTVFVPDILMKDGRFNEESLQQISGFAEPAVSQLKHGEIVQFERFGFVRIEKEDDSIVAFFTHR